MVAQGQPEPAWLRYVGRRLMVNRLWFRTGEVEAGFDGATGRDDAHIWDDELVVGEVLIGLHRYVISIPSGWRFVKSF